MRDGKMISGFFQHIECIQIAGRQKLPSEEVFMEIKNYYELAKNDTLLIADERSLRVIFNLGHEHLITNIYKKVFVTPEIYNSIIKSLDVEGIKAFKKSFEKLDFTASNIAVNSLMDSEKILTKDEAFALLSCMSKRMDALIDDPRKAKIFSYKRIHVVRPGDIAVAAAVTNEKRR